MTQMRISASATTAVVATAVIALLLVALAPAGAAAATIDIKGKTHRACGSAARTPSRQVRT